MVQKKKNDRSMPRRDFLKHSVVAGATLGSAGVGGCNNELASEQVQRDSDGKPVRGKSAVGSGGYNTWYRGEQLNRIAFPMGGMGAGMICLDGTGSFSHLSLRHQPDVYNEPNMFGAICVKGEPNVARVLEGPVPRWKAFGAGGTGNGAAGKNYGLTRCTDAAFLTRFPFATIKLTDKKLPLEVEMTGWSPFVPGDPDSASLPMAGLDYTFSNKSSKAVEAVFSFNSNNFMVKGKGGPSIRKAQSGFLLWNEGTQEHPHEHGVFCVSTPDPAVKVSHSWFRGGWWDPLTMLWKDIQAGACYDRDPVTENGPAPGASLYVPFTLEPGQQKTITVQLSWYVPTTDLRAGPGGGDAYAPWYSGKFKSIEEVAAYWRDNYERLRDESKKFSDCFYDMTLPPEVIEAVAANLTILKSPTVLRQADGKLWAWEGCGDGGGCCHGSCTHVWNYAQALSHLFPSLERTLRETEFGPSQDDKGHQTFRASLPIRQPDHNFHAACDGQLGGIMKVYREWRISGDTGWLRSLWPKVRASINYCIQTWDPGKKGILEEPHHNTYDIEFWGPDGMCTSFYLGALTAAVTMGKTLNEDVAEYESLISKGLAYMQSELFDGEYFIQKVVVANRNPDDVQSFRKSNAPESTELFAKEGPKYQYGTGCLSDGILGEWMAEVCGIGSVLDAKKAASHLKAIHRYNFKTDLIEHVNPQRPSYAFGIDGGLLLCSWPKGGEPSLPFVYSNEVWTGIEYQVASHLMIAGMVEQGLEIVRAARDRYDGEIRNPFNEYECGHWYARAMSSYALIQGMSGVRYDAIDKTLHIKPSVKGDFRAFLSTATGYGIVGVKGGKTFIDVKSGSIEVSKIDYVSA